MHVAKFLASGQPIEIMKIPLSKPGTELALDHQRKICTVTPEAHRFVLRDSRLSHRRGRCCRSSEDPSPGDPGGDAKLQDTLVSMIKLEIGKKQVGRNSILTVCYCY